MTVSLTFSDASGGDSLTDTTDLGTSVNPGDDTSVQDIFIRHDGVVNPITDCAWYVTRYAGINYLGSDADADYTEMMGWGDAGTGGAIINQVIPLGWTTGDDFADGTKETFKNGTGDINSPIILDQNAINIGTPTGDGEIPISGEAHVQFKVEVPSSLGAGAAGYRAFSLVFAYSATS